MAEGLTLSKAQLKLLRCLLEEVEEYFDNRADAEYFTDSPSPVGNLEMEMLILVNDASRLLNHAEQQN